MKRFISFVALLLMGISCSASRPDNKPVPRGEDKTIKCVMMGDSITEIWRDTRHDFFGKNGIVSAGIGGQTSTQMLVRFENDVVNRSPLAVSILCGINDIAQNQGYISNDDICANIAAMAEMATNAGIKVIICSTLPANKIAWNPSVGNPAPLVADLNAKTKNVALKNGYYYLDYYSVLVADDGGLPPSLTTDGVHVTPSCYEKLEEMFLAKLAEVLGK